jgi:FdhE protein
MGSTAPSAVEDNSSRLVFRRRRARTHITVNAVSSTDRWTPRIARARALSARHPAAADILRFYAQLAAHQQTLAADWAGAPWDPPLVLSALPTTLDWLARSGPEGLARIVSALRDAPSDWAVTLDRYLAGAPFEAHDAPRAFVIETLLQPLAEQCASAAHSPQTGHDNARADARCPFCQQRPSTGVLRDAGQGTRRGLVCGLCFTEWAFERIVCPSCGERRFDALPVYTAEQVSGARIDGCDSCGVYLKTIDASKDGMSVPEVDDLATLTLDLWARERGYQRLRTAFYP